MTAGELLFQQIYTTPVEIEMTRGGTIVVTSLPGNNVKLNNKALIVEPDLIASNGILHGIDAVLLPRKISIGDLCSP